MQAPLNARVDTTPDSADISGAAEGAPAYPHYLKPSKPASPSSLRSQNPTHLFRLQRSRHLHFLWASGFGSAQLPHSSNQPSMAMALENCLSSARVQLSAFLSSSVRSRLISMTLLAASEKDTRFRCREPCFRHMLLPRHLDRTARMPNVVTAAKAPSLI